MLIFMLGCVSPSFLLFLLFSLLLRVSCLSHVSFCVSLLGYLIHQLINRLSTCSISNSVLYSSLGQTVQLANVVLTLQPNFKFCSCLLLCCLIPVNPLSACASDSPFPDFLVCLILSVPLFVCLAS